MIIFENVLSKLKFSLSLEEVLEKCNAKKLNLYDYFEIKKDNIEDLIKSNEKYLNKKNLKFSDIEYSWHSNNLLINPCKWIWLRKQDSSNLDNPIAFCMQYELSEKWLPINCYYIKNINDWYFNLIHATIEVNYNNIKYTFNTDNAGKNWKQIIPKSSIQLDDKTFFKIVNNGEYTIL